MADGNFRAYRRDAVAPRSADVPARAQFDDPLAELARLIGQSETASERGRGQRRFDETQSGLDWAAGDGYAEPNEPPAGQNYDAGYDHGGEPVSEPYPSYRPGPSPQDAEYEAEAAEQFSAPVPKFNAVRDGARGLPAEQPQHRHQQEPGEFSDAELPAFLPRSRDGRYQYDDASQDGSGDQAYAAEDYEAEQLHARRRGGLIVVVAVLGLAVLGTAGAFAYRAMFGASMLPALPPIIKADDGPNKIVPSNSKGSTSPRADANAAGSGEKLVSREEQPVEMPVPVNPAPRVVSTIPIFPDPNSAQAGMAASSAANNSAPVAPLAAPPTAASPPLAATAPAVSAPPARAAPAPAAPPASSVVSPEPKKIRTVAIRPNQSGGLDEAAPAPPPSAVAPAPVSVRAPPSRAAAQPAPKPVAAPQPEPNAPLPIVPQQGALPPPPAAAHTHTALAQPTPLTAAAQPTPPTAPAQGTAAAPPSGGYAVQITSQRSEAEAQAEFRALRAKYPHELGGHEPIVRRADLGAKGVFYRAMVGPFVSMEQAAAMCSSLKAAGGTCLVQRD